MNGQWGAVGERFDGGGEAAMGEDRRVDAMCELAELLDGVARVRERVGDEPAQFGWGVVAGVCELKGHDRVDEALLGAVVEVAHDAAALLVGGLDEPRAGGGEFLSCLGIGDRVGDELGELGDAILGALGGARPAGQAAESAPQMRPPTTTGPATAERTPMRRICSATAPPTSS